MHGAGSHEEALPRFTLGSVFTQWELVSWASVLILLTAVLYLWGVLRMRRRGDHWPVGRTAAFLAAMVAAAVATISGIGTYDDTLLSDHMAQHMILAMIVPLAMALGAPITLALRTLPRRPRGWLLAVLHSRVAKLLSFPPLTFTLFIVTPWALYFSGWYAATLHHDYLHGGAYRFLQRVWRLVVDEHTGAERSGAHEALDDDTLRLLHRTIAGVSDDYTNLRNNTAAAKLIEYTNHLTKQGVTARAALEPLVLMVAPLAPHLAEELWQRLGHDTLLAHGPFPVADPQYLVEDTVELPVQVNGKVRGLHYRGRRRRCRRVGGRGAGRRQGSGVPRRGPRRKR